MFGGMSRLQLKTAVFLLGTLLLGVVIQYWQSRQPLPGVDPALTRKFQNISDSLNAIGGHAGPAVSADSLKNTQNQPKIHFPININRASREALQSLPGIGPVLAQRIIDYREQYGPIKQKEQLLKIKGIGQKKLQRFIHQITF
ncbi:MAG: helix-hairpin-helix domain-containing protein [Calditrichaeota bacterium]|nr:MAG: helix-hairpin-helix domain-containing protein [Calditrichota bacterium]